MKETAKGKKTQAKTAKASKKTNVSGTTNSAKSISAARRRRVNRLKRMIIVIILIAIIIPNIICVYLGIQVVTLRKKLSEAEEARDALLETMAEGSYQLIGDEFLLEEEENSEGNIGKKHQQSVAAENASRKVYLTFDDGPSENTERILEVLERYGVKATFFVTGEEAESHPERYQAIVNAGHTIGMHSYSHKYSEIYTSVDEFSQDFVKLKDYIKETTGVTPKYYRFPGGSNGSISELPMSIFCSYLTENGITYFDWNVSGRDAVSPMRTVVEIVYNCTVDLERYDDAVILLHDAVNKDSTVDALPEIIETILAMEDTAILPITDDTVVIRH